MPSRVWAVITLSILILRSTAALLRSCQNQAVVELALRQPRAIYNRRHPRSRIARIDRAFWVALSRSGPHGKSVLGIVQPETGVRWHPRRFRALVHELPVSGHQGPGPRDAWGGWATVSA